MSAAARRLKMTKPDPEARKRFVQELKEELGWIEVKHERVKPQPQTELEKLRAKVLELESENQALKSKVEQLEKDLDQMWIRLQEKDDSAP